MLGQQALTTLQQNHWTVAKNDTSPAPPETQRVEVWKPFANGVAITLSLHAEEGQFVLYTDLGHAGAGTNRTESGRFSTLDAAIDQLIEACSQWDGIWEA